MALPEKQTVAVVLLFLLSIFSFYHSYLRDTPGILAVAPTEKVLTKASTVHYTSTDLFEIHFPQCHPANVSWLSWLETHGFYQTTKDSPRYDYTCPVMKARYNCAHHPNATVNTSQAYQYQFVWKHPNHTEVCDLRQLVDFIGGPASSILHGQHIHLQGNSYLRQIWESLVCSYPHQISNLTLYHDGPSITMGALQSRQGKLISPDELGTLVQETNVSSIDGCHAPGSSWPMECYYRPTIPLPSNRDDCSDDVSLVQFNKGITFTYIFRPNWFDSDALLATYLKLGIVDGQVQTLVSMGSIGNGTDLTPASHINFGSVLGLLKEKQHLTLGSYFGADNPWITEPPDVHPCMPGIPDDESNILLWLLLLQDYHKNDA